MRLARARPAAVMLLLAALAACSDGVSPPSGLETVNATRNYEDEPCEPWMIICNGEPNDPTWYDDGYEETSTAEAALSYEASSSSEMLYCPDIFSQSMTTITVACPKPDGGFPQNVPISFMGTWTIKTRYSLDIADYWFPPGYFPAVDGSGIQAQVSYGTAQCYLVPNLVIVRFYSGKIVNCRWPRRSTSSSGGGPDGNGGGGSNCHMEYIIIEINYGDGTGWHTWWEGWANVCE